MRIAALIAAGALVPATALAATHDFANPASHDTSQQFSYGSVQRQDTPNDPDYDQSEPDGHPRTSTNFFDERFDLFGFPSQLTPSAIYREGPHVGRFMVAGFNAAGAWKATRGRGAVAVAILDTGIKWDKRELRDKVRLNTGELPLPRDAGGTHPGAPLGGYDLNRNGVVDVDDYANDPRVRGVVPAGQAKPTGQDLIHAFSDGIDGDHNGYVDDIAGWDFFNNDNDPYDASSYFAASNHGSGRTQEAVEQGNDGDRSIGVCPKCQFIPIRVWDTFVSDANTFGLGIVYATDNGAKVIEGADGSLYHSHFSEAASNYAYRHGVVQTYSGDDLNTGNHNYPANYSHTMLIQGTVPDTAGLGEDAGQEIAQALSTFHLPVGTNLPVGTFFRGANTTQYGGHSSISMEGSTGSTNTGKASGAAALVISAALERGIRLAPDETREILEQTAEDVTGGPTGVDGNVLGLAGAPDRAVGGWDLHFGWGRVDLGAAVAVVRSGKIPAEAAISTPDWYAPETGGRVEITGLARARFASGGRFHWKLEWAPGITPSPGAWRTVRQGDASGTLRRFGTIDLAQVRAALPNTEGTGFERDPGQPIFAPGEPNPYQQQFNVRVTVTAAGIPTPGVDRRVLTTFRDGSLRRGYPRRLGTGGEAPPRYADLNGDNVPELLIPGEDGVLRAIEPDGRELRGWPVRTRIQAQARNHRGSPALRTLGAPLEPLRGPVVADLEGDGRPEVIDAAGTHVYVWEANGRLRRGFPVSVDLRLCRGIDQSQPLHHRKCGFIASPGLGRLQGARGPLDIVIPALDGHLYAFRPDGRLLPHFPVDLVDPGVPAAKRLYAESINSPAIGDLNHDGRADVVVASNETYPAEPPSGPAGDLAQAFADLLGGAAGGSSRVYAIDGRTGRFLPGWPIKLNGAIQDVLPLIGPGHDAALARFGGRQTVVVSTTGGALAEYGVDGREIRAAQQNVFGPQSDATERSSLLNLFEYAVVGRVLGSGPPDIVKYGLTLGQLVNLALAGQNVPYHHTIGAYDGTNGRPLSHWPTVTDDYQLLSSSTIAKVAPGAAANQVIAGTGLGLLHAYDGSTGHDAAGFPKQTGGWLFAPAALSDDGRIADVTREGYLFEWSTRAPSCQSEWPAFRHDQEGTGNYDADGTPPGAPGRLRLRHLGGRRFRLSFVSPGDDNLCGRAAAYITEVNGRGVNLHLGRPVPGGHAFARTVTLPAGTRRLTIRARDEVRNVGANATAALPGRRGSAQRPRHRRRHHRPRFTG